ncbi:MULTISPECIES: hypothetical protein [Vibrio]|uniref:hypothetical protein n=1 Tax=Vibrio TaxID=662 RepID=UPI00030F598F|nr:MULTISPECIES: hypothetical protein [Vibrio]MDE3898550.1 hypothetical protein [Vibrio sp. CC007]
MSANQVEDKKNSKSSQNTTIGGVSAVLIGVTNLVFLGKPEVQGIVTTAVPIVVTGFFKFANYSFVYLGLDDMESLKARVKLEKKIKFYEKRLKQANEIGRDESEIDELKKCLLDAEKAMGQLPI